jgi:hypothetical protein
MTWPIHTASQSDWRPTITSGARRRFAIIAAPLAFVSIAAVLGLPLCPSAFLLRIPCPGCGLTRASLALLRGDLATAHALQPAVLLVLPLLAASLGWVGVQYIVTGRSTPPRWALGALIASFVALSLVWAARILGAFGGPVPV